MIRKWLHMILLGTAVGCVEPISFDTPSADEQLVVEGYVSNGSGPHRVLLSLASSVTDSISEKPVTGAEIILYEDRVRVAQFTEVNSGVYELPEGTFFASVGKKYHIEIKTLDGHRFHSIPDLLESVGTVDEINTEYEKRTVLTETGESDASVLKVTVDGVIGERNDVLTRWRFKITYEAETFPMWHITENPPYDPLKDPFPCSGYIVTEGPVFSGGLVIKIGECECCNCWAEIYEPYPSLSDDAVINDGRYFNMKVGEVPISPAVFEKRAMITVEQMSLSQTAFDFFNLIESQKKNAQNIFQPVSGELKGNIIATNSSDKVIGLFYATSVNTASMMLDSTDLPVKVPAATYLTWPCADIYDNASYNQPELWE